MSLPAIRQAIVDTLNAANVGTFFKKERYAKNKGDMAEAYGKQPIGGYIRKIGRKTTSENIGRNQTRYRFEVVYLFPFSDTSDSQIAFEDNLEKLQDKFLNDEKLTGIAGSSHVVDDTVGLEEIDNQPVVFAGVLCHRSRMVLQVQIYH